jgi:serine/threonine protein kinase
MPSGRSGQSIARFSTMPLTAGARLGGYEIGVLIGKGGMGEVWHARDTKLNRDVALKVLPEAFALDADRLARFKRGFFVAGFSLVWVANVYMSLFGRLRLDIREERLEIAAAESDKATRTKK